MLVPPLLLLLLLLSIASVTQPCLGQLPPASPPSLGSAPLHLGGTSGFFAQTG
eukprot:CAMPEP_0203866870 /NCGR_PEP_ID=MMETSP0359-20131031/16200_1 /ASSEMBLY_ACC=CAM_ASM_000338 /TAXON_ID=268821 /ORGANISM="Scrippsiella Hangoei, Strain SHTV-5" /LENGTH=52 /DNA_ID=CAMNT_0050785033 /DNA_START=78 /DNA_END=233 /DNA_ORIENTATION=+